MKKFKFAFLAIVAVVTLSCSSDDNNTVVPDNDETFIRFKVNGVQSNMIEPTTFTSMAASILGTENVGPDIRTMILRTPATAAAGTHDLVDNASDLTVYGASYSFGDVNIDANSGSMIITSIGEEYMTGTFSFSKVVDGTTYNFTEGTFRVLKPTPPSN